MSAYTTPLLSTTAATEVAEACPDRTALIFTVYDAAQVYDGMQQTGIVLLSPDIDAGVIGSRRGSGIVLHHDSGPLRIEGAAARRRWTARAQYSGNQSLGVMEIFDPTPVEKPHRQGEPV